MAKSIRTAERVSNFGNQVFVFKLPNGRTLELEFCPHLMNPGGDACSAVATLLDKNGARLPIAVSDSRTEKAMMKLPALWLSSEEEDSRHSQMVSEELDAILRGFATA